MYLIFIIFSLLLVIIILSRRMDDSGVHEDFVSYKKCKEKRVRGILKEIFDQNNFNYDENNWDLYMPCGYNFVETELKNLKPNNNSQKIFGISGCDSIVSKNSLWSLLETKYKREFAKTLMPETFILGDAENMKIFEEKYDKSKYYILKKNVQRKLGLKISNNYFDIINSIKDGFKVVQEYKADTFVINKRMMNLRIYMLVTCKNNNINIYLHELGKCLYTSKDITNDMSDFDSHITNSYKLSGDLYKTNPKSLNELKIYLDRNKYNSQLLFNRIDKNLKLVGKAIVNSLCKINNIKDNLKFQLFGLDVIFNDKMEPYLLEMNKGPDMIPKDMEDKKLKTKVEVDMLEKIKLIKVDDKNYNNGFYKILEV